ncbi:MAG TPA: guanine deaminase [Planktothrix sp.]|jgi:guanine deaminase
MPVDQKNHNGSDNSFYIYGGHLLSPESPSKYLDLRQGAIVVDGRGKIAGVGPLEAMRKRYPNAPVSDFGDRLILPGLIDLHIHLPQFTQIGKSGQTLLGWLEKYIFPAEMRFSDPEHARRIAHWFFEELARNGTTFAAVFTTLHWQSTDVAFQVAKEMGSRVIMGKVLMDRNAPPSLQDDTDDSIARTLQLCEKWHGQEDGRLLYSFIPRFAITSTEKQMHEAAKLWHAHPGTYMHTHLAESLEECVVVQKMYPQSRSYTDVYERMGMLGERSIYAHSIHLNDEDIKRLAQTNSSIAHCPSSNFFLKSGSFQYKRVENAGVRFGLGSDVAAGPYMSLFEVMRDANYMQGDDWLSPAECLYRATLGGAQAAFLDDKLGSLTEGKEADFIVVNPNRKSGIAANILKQSTEEILSSIVFMGDDRLIEATFVRGRCLFELESGLVTRAAQTYTGTHN